MRLIDVDKLIEYFDGDLEGYDNREYILHMLDTKGRIERIKAIPIEWIKKHYGWLTMANEIIKDWEKHESRDTESTK